MEKLHILSTKVALICAADNERSLFSDIDSGLLHYILQLHSSAFVLQGFKGSNNLIIIQLILVVCNAQMFTVLSVKRAWIILDRICIQLVKYAEHLVSKKQRNRNALSL